MNREPLLQARDLRPAGIPEALPLELELGEGFVCMVGPEQARLTGYLRCMAGVESGAGGWVRLLGRTPGGRNLPGWQLLRRSVGFVTPDAPLLSIMSGLRNVMLPALYHGIASEPEVEGKARALLAELDYPADHSALPAYMTPLQRHHLLIARASILEPQLLCIDQPFHGMDGGARGRLRDYILTTVRRRVPLLLVAANDALLAREADTVLYIGSGCIRRYAGWAELLAGEDEEVRRFVEHERAPCGAFE